MGRIPAGRWWSDAGGATIPLEWLKGGPFTDYTVPALALGILVGGSSLIAALLVVLRPAGGAIASMVAGAMIIGFELVEIAVVGFTLIEYDASQFQAWLQVIYLALGGVQVLLGYRFWRAAQRAAGHPVNQWHSDRGEGALHVS